MPEIPDRPTRETLSVLLGGVFLVLFVLVTLSAGTATAEEVESGENVTVYRVANGSVSDLEAVETAIRTGRAERSEQVVMGEPVIATFESARFARSMSEANGSTTARFLTALEGNATFRVIQTNPTPEVTRLLAVIGQENLTVYRNDTQIYAVLDTDALSFTHRDSSIWEENVTQGERFAVQFGYELPEEWPRWEDPTSPIVEFVPSEDQLTTAEPTTSTPSITQSTRTTTSRIAETTTASTQTPTTGSPTASTQTPTGSNMSTDGATPTDGEGGEPTAIGAPGFTAATMLVALLGLVLLGRRS